MDALSFHPLAELFPLIEGREFGELTADIKANGLREPVVLDRPIAVGGQIVDGRNRYRACQAAGVSVRFEVLPEGTDLRAFVISKNLHRRHLNESQRAMVAARLADMPSHRPDDKSANLQTSQAEAATLVNVSQRSVASAKAVQEKGTPELVRAVEQGHLPVSAAAQATRLQPEQQRRVAEEATAGRANVARTVLKKETRDTREAELGDKQRALPDRKYGVILADPEWRFEVYSRETGMDRAADNHYPTSSTEAIAARPVASIAADDCLLLLWATVPMLPEALKVMAAWGFSYKTHFVWLKPNPGTGYWNRNQHELLLLGTRGNIPAPAPGTQFRSTLASDTGAHSEKPPFAHEIAEAYFPSLPKIELNARRVRAGWDAWGLEAPERGPDIPARVDETGVGVDPVACPLGTLEVRSEDYAKGAGGDEHAASPPAPPSDPEDDGLDIPAFLHLTSEQRAAAWRDRQ